MKTQFVRISPPRPRAEKQTLPGGGGGSCSVWVRGTETTDTDTSGGALAAARVYKYYMQV